MPQPNPDAKTFDLKWQALCIVEATDFTDREGRVYRAGFSPKIHLDWMWYQVDNIHDYIYLETVTQKYTWNETYVVEKQAIVCGIVGLNWDEKVDPNGDDPGFFGYRIKYGGSYQGGGWSAGPTFFTGTSFYRSEVRFLQFKPHGSSQGWSSIQYVKKGIDGDTVYPERPR
jgi:hypothetical protein